MKKLKELTLEEISAAKKRYTAEEVLESLDECSGRKFVYKHNEDRENVPFDYKKVLKSFKVCEGCGFFYKPKDGSGKVPIGYKRGNYTICSECIDLIKKGHDVHFIPYENQHYRLLFEVEVIEDEE